jgi:integrase
LGRNRKKAYQQLPKYIYVNRGRYIYRPPAQKDIVLGKITSLDIPAVWESYRQLTETSEKTLDYLVSRYLKSTEYNNLKSKRDVKRLLENLLNTDAKGRFGSKHYVNITPGVIRNYLDYKNSVTANREISALSAAWRYCYERDIVRVTNPCKGVRRIPESPRDRYISDAEYKTVYDLAPDHYKVAMELAYLCRMRRNEVLDTRYRDVESDGLNTRRLKGSNSALTLWTPRLRAAVEMGLKGKMRVPDMPLVGMGIKGDTFTQGFRKLVKRAGVEWFVFHDIKAKGVSDFTGDKRKAGGHKSEKMVDIYDRKRIVIEATE